MNPFSLFMRIIASNVMAHMSPFELTILRYFSDTNFCIRDKFNFYVDEHKIIFGFPRKFNSNGLLLEKIN